MGSTDTKVRSESAVRGDSVRQDGKSSFRAQLDDVGTIQCELVVRPGICCKAYSSRSSRGHA